MRESKGTEHGYD